MSESKKKNAVIAAKNISKTYLSGSDEFKAVKDVTLDIYEDDFTVNIAAFHSIGCN